MNRAQLAEIMSEKFDPILLEIMRHGFISVSEEMNITMAKTTRSIIAKEGGDYSAGILDAAGRVIAQAVPYGLGYFTTVMPHIIKKFAGRFEPGDIVISNDPYGGLSHLPDIAVVMPIFWRNQHCGFAGVVQHHTDIGGRFPGGMGLSCGEIYEEGLRLPGVKLYRKGEPDEAVREIIATNVRTPDDVLGDLEAAVASCRRAGSGLLKLFEKYGRETVENCHRALYRQAEQVMRGVLQSVPDGHYRVEDVFDDGVDTRVLLVVTLVVQGSSLVFDFTGTGSQVKNALNAPPGFVGSMVSSTVLLELLGNADPPINSGLFAPITSVAPLGTLVNPKFPAAVGSRGQILWRFHDMVCEALAQAIPDRMPAASEGGTSHMLFTPHIREAADVLADMMDDRYASGGGARSIKDGVEGVYPPIARGSRSNPGEAFERELPLMLEGFGFVPDTGGPGKFRGALSLYRRWRFLADGRVMLRTCRVDSVPYGLAHGKPGTPFKALLISGGQQTELPARTMLDIQVRAGDVLVHTLPGAGGYGEPFTRDPEKVLADVLDQKITPAYAEREYGVAIDMAAETVDLDKTRAFRAKSRMHA